MKWQDYISSASTIALLLPVLVIFFTRVFANRHFALLGIYYLMAFFYNLITSGFLQVSTGVKRFAALFINLLDAPLIVGFLLFFTLSWKLTKKIKMAIAVFAGFELLVLAIAGWGFKTSAIILGPGILMILICCSYFFIQKLQTQPGEPNPAGAIMILSALLFSYGCFMLIYIFHYILQTPNTEDVFLVFYMVTTFASILMAAGIWKESRSKQFMPEKKRPSDPGRVQNTVTQMYVDENEFRYK